MNTYATMIMANRGFVGAKVNAKDMAVEQVKAWRDAVNKVHNVAYEVAAIRYNQVGGDAGILASKFYDALHGVYALIGELDNGAKLRMDQNALNTIVSMAVAQRTRKDPALERVEGMKRTDMRYLKTLEETNGANPEAIAKIKANIEEFDKQIAELKEQSMMYYKQMGKCSASAFYKAFEDFLADQIEARSILTEEQVQAEKKARNAARKAKREAANK